MAAQWWRGPAAAITATLVGDTFQLTTSPTNIKNTAKTLEVQGAPSGGTAVLYWPVFNPSA